MSQDIRSRTGDAFNFPDGLKVAGVDISSKDGGSLVGTYKSLTDTTPTLLQAWVSEVAQKLEQLELVAAGSGVNPTATTQALTDNSQNKATTEFVHQLLAQELGKLLGGAVSPFTVLMNLITAVNGDANMAQTLNNALSAKATLKDIQLESMLLGTASGNGDAVTATFTPAITQLFDGLQVRFKSKSANTQRTVSFTPNSGLISPRPIIKGVSVDLDVGDIPSANYECLLQYDALQDYWVLMNPAYPVSTNYASLFDAQAGTSSTMVLTPASVKAVLAAKAGVAPAVMDTLAEFAQAIGNDPNYAQTVATLISQKLDLAAPVYTGDMWVPTPAITDASNKLANMEFLDQKIAQALASGGIPAATQDISGAARFATDAELAAGAAVNLAFTPSQLTQALSAYAPSTTTYNVVMKTVAPPDGDVSEAIITTKFVVDRLSLLPTATSVIRGMVEAATRDETLAGTSDILSVTPYTLAEAIALLPVTPQATTSLKGKARFATATETQAGALTDVMVAPSVAKSYVQAARTANPTAVTFDAPLLTGANAHYVGQAYSLGMSATPVNGAASITKFTVTVKNNLTGANAYNQTTDVTATGNAASFSLTIPSNASNSQLTITVIAVDNLTKSSSVATKSLSSSYVVINTPVITAPTAGQTNLALTPTFAVSGFGTNTGSDTHKATVWTIYNSTGTLALWTSGEDITNLLTLTMASGILTTSTTFKLGVKFVGATFGAGAESFVTFSTTATGAKITRVKTLTPTTGHITPLLGTCIDACANADYVIANAFHTTQTPTSAYNATTNKYVGRVYIWKKSGSGWVEDSFIEHDPAEVTDGKCWHIHGCKISDDGTRIAITCRPFTFTANMVAYVRVKVYVRDTVTNTWSLETNQLLGTTYTRAAASGLYSLTYRSIACVGLFEDERFDFAKAGDQIVVGVEDAKVGTIAGAGVVFYLKRVGSTWTAAQEITKTGTITATDYFGRQVKFTTDGTKLLIACENDDVLGSNLGCIYHYEKDANGLWTKLYNVGTSTLAIGSYPRFATNSDFSRMSFYSQTSTSAASQWVVVGGETKTEYYWRIHTYNLTGTLTANKFDVSNGAFNDTGDGATASTSPFFYFNDAGNLATTSSRIDTDDPALGSGAYALSQGRVMVYKTPASTGMYSSYSSPQPSTNPYAGTVQDGYGVKSLFTSDSRYHIASGFTSNDASTSARGIVSIQTIV